MNIPLKLPNLNRPHPILVPRIIILLHSNLTPILRNTLNPSNMPQRRPRTRLRNRILLRLLVDFDAGPASRACPEFCIAPVLAFVPVAEVVDSEDFVDAPGDEAHAFAFVEAPVVDVVFGVAGVFVGVVVSGALGDGSLGGLEFGGEGQSCGCGELGGGRGLW